MDRLWSPWRFSYVSQAAGGGGCIFCEKTASQDDERNYVIYRGGRNFILLNIYPYTNGHMMIAPYRHVATLQEASEETLAEMMALARLAETHLHNVYRPSGMNIGMNLGECAGAGVAGHLHLHVLPRWAGDASFMTTVAETRVLPEDLRITWRKLKTAFAAGR